MKFKDTGFRALYRQFTVFPLSGESREDMAAYPQIEGANCLLAYGFIDREAGLTLEVLAAGYELERLSVLFMRKGRKRLSLKFWRLCGTAMSGSPAMRF